MLPKLLAFIKIRLSFNSEDQRSNDQLAPTILTIVVLRLSGSQVEEGIDSSIIKRFERDLEEFEIVFHNQKEKYISSREYMCDNAKHDWHYYIDHQDTL